MSKIDIGIDLGTANTVIYQKSKGIVLHEPTVVAVSDENGIMAVGQQAKEMLGRTPTGIRAINPIKNGVVSDFDMTVVMIDGFIKRIITSHFRPKFRALLAVPIEITNVETKALQEVVSRSVLREAIFVEQIMASALGAKFDISSPRGMMVVDIGSSTTEIAVISLGGVVASKSVNIGGDLFNDAISSLIRKKYGIIAGYQSIERIKVEISTVMTTSRNHSTFISGKNLVSGLTSSAQVSGCDIRSAILPGIYRIIDSIKEVFSEIPAELASDILNSGIELVGGGAHIDGIDRIICNAIGIPVRIADNPVNSVALGLGEIIEKNVKIYKT